VDASAFEAYVRVKAVFEATREAGWWRIGWDVTNREPQSDAIWSAWRSARGVPRVSAVAECDETSALAAVILRRLKVPSVGLFWPTSNHTVAVWKPRDRAGRESRIVLPTSQVFLDPMDGFATTAFDVRVQRTIHDYTRRDVGDQHAIPGTLAAFFVGQARRYAGASDAAQRGLRVLRARFMSGATAAGLEADRRGLLDRMEAPADRAAVEAFADEMAGR
jgi:hypothetical protein